MTHFIEKEEKIKKKKKKKKKKEADRMETQIDHRQQEQNFESSGTETDRNQPTIYKVEQKLTRGTEFFKTEITQTDRKVQNKNKRN